MQTAVQSELDDIAAARRTLLEKFRSGDFTTQRQAFESLSALAEDYFPKFLAESVALISDANQLDDRIRQRTISADVQSVEKRNLVLRGVELLKLYEVSAPVSRTLTRTNALTGNQNAPTNENYKSEDGEAQQFSARPLMMPGQVNLTELIIPKTEPERNRKLLIAHGIAKVFPQSSFELRPISLELNRGEILGIVGINASGKTTLLRMLLGELSLSRGVLLFPEFEDLNSRRDWKQIKSRMGYVSQTLSAWPGQLYDNLCYAASVFGHPRTKIDAHLDLLLKRYGLDKFKNAKWAQISGGYKARFEIARVLLANPDILILDEPLAYLDIISQQIVLRQLKQLSRNRANPIGVVVTSQQLYEIEAIADRLLVLDGGNILYSERVNRLPDLIASVAIEFGTNDPLTTVKQKLVTLSSFKTLFAAETGFIAIFEKPLQGSSSDIFNQAVAALISNGGHLSHARDISCSSRLLFEPAIADALKSKSE